MAEGLRTGAHELYFTRLLEGELHPAFQGLDANRMTVAYFAITALDVLGALERCRTRDAIVEWILAQQVLPRCARCAGGFRGGSSSGAPFCAGGAFPTHAFDGPHLASTYTALASLLALGDDLARVRRDAVLRGVRALQQPDGSFCAFAGGESDMRFVFCAAAVGTMLGDGDGDGDGGGGGGGGGGDGAWACLDRPSAIAYIPEGGIGLGPGQEAHGGSTFCALAALHLLGALGTLDRPDLAARWCAERQLRGFQGRANKDEDTCYSYWLGASLALLGHAELVAVRECAQFTCRCQSEHGGLCKHEGAQADPLHSCLALCGLSLLGQPGLQPIEPALGITRRAWARARLRCAHLQRAAPAPARARAYAAEGAGGRSWAASLLGLGAPALALACVLLAAPAWFSRGGGVAPLAADW